MVLYKATEDGQIPMGAEEEAQIRADWKNFEDAAKKPKPKTLEEWTAEVDKRLKALEKVSTDDKK